MLIENLTHYQSTEAKVTNYNNNIVLDMSTKFHGQNNDLLTVFTAETSLKMFDIILKPHFVVSVLLIEPFLLCSRLRDNSSNSSNNKDSSNSKTMVTVRCISTCHPVLYLSQRGVTNRGPSNKKRST